MLKGIPKIVSPALLKVLAEMGHGDEIVIADAHFPAETFGQRVIRADGLGGVEMLQAVLSLIPLDTYAKDNFVIMQLTGNDTEIPPIWEEYRKTAKALDDNVREQQMERFNFYNRAHRAYAVIATGETAIYANIILKKGVVK